MKRYGISAAGAARRRVAERQTALEQRHLRGRLRTLLLADAIDSRRVRDELDRWNLVAAWPTLHVLKGLLREPELRQRRRARLLLLYFGCVQRFLCLQTHRLADTQPPRALAIAEAIGDRLLVEMSRYRLASRQAVLGHKTEALEKISEHLPEMIEVRGVEGLLLVLHNMADTCCELGWHDRMLELTRLAFLILHSADATVDRTRMVTAMDSVEHAVLRAIDTRFHGRPTEFALALAELRPTFERSRHMLQTLQARYFLGALTRYEFMMAWLEGSLSDDMAERLIGQAFADPPIDEAFRFIYIRLAAAMACIEREDNQRARLLLERSLDDTRPGDFVLQSVCYALLAGVWSRLQHWEAAFRSLEQADAARTRRRDESLQSRMGAMLGRLKRDNLLAIGFVGHDLRAPLSAIHAVAQMTCHHEGDPLAKIRVLAAKALAYTDEYLRFVELQLVDSSAFEPVDLRDVLDDVIEEMRVAGGYRTLRIEDLYETEVVRSHFPTVRRIFANVLHNAAEASGVDGRIRIEVTKVGADAVVAIHDSGGGIPADRLPTLFDDVVHKATAKSTGHGLGLRFVARAVHALSGTVFAANRPAGGASVYVALPLAAAPDAA